MTRCAPLLLAVVAACGSGDAARPSATVVARDAAATVDAEAPALEASWDGRPLVFTHAVAASLADGALVVLTGTGEITCEDLTRPPPPTVARDVRLKLHLAPYQATGLWLITTAGVVGNLGQTEVTGGAAPGEQLSFDVNLDVRAAGGPDPLAVKGTLVARGCGAR